MHYETSQHTREALMQVYYQPYPSHLQRGHFVTAALFLLIAACSGDGSDGVVTPSSAPSESGTQITIASSAHTGDEDNESRADPDVASTDLGSTADGDADNESSQSSPHPGGGGGFGCPSPVSLSLADWVAAMDLVVIGTVLEPVQVRDYGFNYDPDGAPLLDADNCTTVHPGLSFEVVDTRTLHGEAPERIRVQFGPGALPGLSTDRRFPAAGSRVVLGLWNVEGFSFLDMGVAAEFMAAWIEEAEPGQWVTRLTYNDGQFAGCKQFHFSFPEFSDLDEDMLASLLTEVAEGLQEDVDQEDNPLRAAADERGALTSPEDRPRHHYMRWFGGCVRSSGGSGTPPPPDCASWDDACFGENPPESCEGMEFRCVCDHTPDCTLAFGDGWTCDDGRCVAP